MSSVLDLRLFGSVMVTLLVIMNPIGAVPIFLGLTRSQTYRQRVVSARRASLVALGVIAAFAVFGQQILSYLHISLAALQGAGGLLLLLVALQLLTGQESGGSSDAGVNVALVPLGTPLLAGLEVHHRDHDPEQVRHGLDLAASLDLFVTGSSDYHGAGKVNRLGENTTDPIVLQRIEDLAMGMEVLRP